MTVRRVPHRFTVSEYEEMIRRGILKEDLPVELIFGEVVAKMPVGSLHGACVKRLNRRLTDLVGDRAIVSVQDPVRLAESEPEPDLALLAPRADYYASGTPGAADVLLVIEVADTSLDDDRELKGFLYSKAGIGEYWIVNLVDRCLEIYRRPRPDGTYADARTLRPGDTADVLALPGLTLAVADLV
jgi:Uma2 family endonuclease